MKIPFHKPFQLIEREDYVDYMFVVLAWEGYTSKVVRSWGFLPGSFLGAAYVSGACNLFAMKEGNDKVNKEHFRMLFDTPEKWDVLHRLTVRNAHRLFVYARRAKAVDLTAQTNRQLLQWVERINIMQAGVHVPWGPMFLLETPNNIVTNYLQDYLARIAQEMGATTPPSDAFQELTAPMQKSNWTKEREELATIGLVRNKDERERRLRRHAKKYEWLEYGIQGKVLDINHFRTELDSMRKEGLASVLTGIRHEPNRIRTATARIIREYGIGKAHRKIFAIAADSLYSRLFSKDAQFFGYYCMEGVLKEIGRRSGMTLEEVRFLTPADFRAVLLRKARMKGLAQRRKRYSVHVSDNGTTRYFVGNEARRIMKRIHFVKDEVHTASTDTLAGQPAYKGKVRGRVKIINTVQDMAKIHAGNILVSYMTNPGIVPAMKQAAAIVTDLGGITCHAAIAACELKKPCVIGTKVATTALRDGDSVEVDANIGVIRKL